VFLEEVFFVLAKTLSPLCTSLGAQRIASQQGVMRFSCAAFAAHFLFSGVVIMDLYKEILAQALTYGEVKITFPGEVCDPAKIVEGECYQALEKIKAVIHDDSLSDKECFMRIEEIVNILESVGSDGGFRHDF